MNDCISQHSIGLMNINEYITAFLTRIDNYTASYIAHPSCHPVPNWFLDWLSESSGEQLPIFSVRRCNNSWARSWQNNSRRRILRRRIKNIQLHQQRGSGNISRTQISCVINSVRASRQHGRFWRQWQRHLPVGSRHHDRWDRAERRGQERSK